MKTDAIVLAGSPNQGRLRECSPVANEALIPIGNRFMVEYVVAALLNSQSIEQIVIVGPVDELLPIYCGQPRVILTEAGKTVLESLQNGVAKLQTPGHVLIATCDIPLLKAEAVDAFLDKCGDLEADLYYPIVSKEINEKYYPGVKRTYVTFKEGTFTGGNLFLFNLEVLPRCAAKGEELVKLRKSPLALSKQIGFLFIVKFLCKLLTLKETEMRFSQLLGLKGKAVILEYPEVGIDVDKPSDLELARKVLA